MADQKNVANQTLWLFALAVLITVLVVVPTTLMNMLSICRPLAEARRMALAIAGGDLSQRIVADGKDEVADLQRALADMQQGLGALVAQVRDASGSIASGTWDGLASLLALNAPEGRKGWYAMIPQLGAPIGLIVASALFAFFVDTLSAEDFLDWGWRYPFFVAFAINVVALFARLRMVVTPGYTELFESRELEPSSVPETVAQQGRTIVVGAFAPLASFALFHMVTVFPLSWVFLFTRETPGRFLVIECIGAVVGIVAMLVSGYIADKVGRRTLLAGSAIAIAVFSGFAPQMLDGGLVGELAFMILGFVLLGLSLGQSSGSVASSFRKRYRYTASALTTDLAWLFGAGFAPLVALVMSSHFGLPSSGIYLLSGAVCTLLAISINRQFASRDAEAVQP